MSPTEEMVSDKLINVAKRVIKYLVKTKDLGITWKKTDEDRKAGFADVIFGAVDASIVMDPITRRNHRYLQQPWTRKLTF